MEREGEVGEKDGRGSGDKEKDGKIREGRGGGWKGKGW